MATHQMIKIDGSFGEGGGQILRSSLALSMLTGQPFEIDNIRAGRKQPGLKIQHLTAVQAAARISGATVLGDEVGSRRLIFEPGTVIPGTYEFEVSTAASMTLVFQAILPALMLGHDPSRLRFRGGTHNLMAPPFDFLSAAYLPQIARLGPAVDCKLRQYGFYPRGGGEFSVAIRPAPFLGTLELLERGQLIQRQVTAVVSDLPVSIARREIDRIQTKSGWPKKCFRTIEVREPVGPGNLVVIEIAFQNVTEVFTGFGQRGVPAEKVADAAWRELQRYLKSNAPVGEHLADQLLLPLGIGAHFGSGGGRFRTLPLSRHSVTQLELLPKFLNIEIDTRDDDGDMLVALQPVAC